MKDNLPKEIRKEYYGKDLHKEGAAKNRKKKNIQMDKEKNYET